MTAFTWALSLVVFDDSFSWALCFAVFGDNASLERTLRSSFGEKNLFTWSCLLDKYVLATTVIRIIEISLEIGPKSYAGNVILGFHFKRADSHRTVEGMGWKAWAFGKIDSNPNEIHQRCKNHPSEPIGKTCCFEFWIVIVIKISNTLELIVAFQTWPGRLFASALTGHFCLAMATAQISASCSIILGLWRFRGWDVKIWAIHCGCLSFVRLQLAQGSTFVRHMTQGHEVMFFVSFVWVFQIPRNLLHVWDFPISPKGCLNHHKSR